MAFVPPSACLYLIRVRARQRDKKPTFKNDPSQIQLWCVSFASHGNPNFFCNCFQLFSFYLSGVFFSFSSLAEWNAPSYLGKESLSILFSIISIHFDKSNDEISFRLRLETVCVFIKTRDKHIKMNDALLNKETAEMAQSQFAAFDTGDIKNSHTVPNRKYA